MDSKSRMPVWVSILAATAVAGLLVVAGCALDKNGVPSENVFTRIGGQNGQLIEPNRCMLKVVILTRPFADPAINEVVWRVADEQVLAPSERRAWESNGLRAGRITGEFPLELEAILKDTTPGKTVVPISIYPDTNEQSLIRISDAVEQASLLLNRDNRAFGKDYNDASGYFRVTRRAQRHPRSVVAAGPRDPPRSNPAQLSGDAQRRSACSSGAQDQRRSEGGDTPRPARELGRRAGPSRRRRLRARAKALPW